MSAGRVRKTYQFIEAHRREYPAENHAHAIALHFMYYKFGGIHKTLRVTPAMEAGVSDHVWTPEEIAALAN